MNFFQYIKLFLVVILMSLGQILFKYAANDMNKYFSILNLKLILAFAVYLFSAFLWVNILRAIPLKTAYPFVALAFIIVPFFASIFFGEILRWNNYLGALIILIGVVITTI
jgi:undecaprenyl phosphate-alpha-L-ara4N flippase subunit ArnE